MVSCLWQRQRAHEQIRKELVSTAQARGGCEHAQRGCSSPMRGEHCAILIFTKTGTGGNEITFGFTTWRPMGTALNDKRDPTEANDIPDIVNRYHNRADELDRARTERSFMVPAVKSSPTIGTSASTDTRRWCTRKWSTPLPMEIIAEIEALDQERQQALANLKSMLG